MKTMTKNEIKINVLIFFQTIGNEKMKTMTKNEIVFENEKSRSRKQVTAPSSKIKKMKNATIEYEKLRSKI